MQKFLIVNNSQSRRLGFYVKKKKILRTQVCTPWWGKRVSSLFPVTASTLDLAVGAIESSPVRSCWLLCRPPRGSDSYISSRKFPWAWPCQKAADRPTMRKECTQVPKRPPRSYRTVCTTLLAQCSLACRRLSCNNKFTLFIYRCGGGKLHTLRYIATMSKNWKMLARNAFDVSDSLNFFLKNTN